MKEREREMAGNTGTESQEPEGNDCSFVWDETTQLYFHASTGFYHDPKAGWYYSSRDSLYYKFENGSYVLLDTEKVNECELDPSRETVSGNPALDESRTDFYSFQIDAPEADGYEETVPDDSNPGQTVCSTQAIENPPPPSEWLEDTLIDLYLSGYNQTVHAAADAAASLEPDDRDKLPSSTTENNDLHEPELEEGEWIPEDGHCFTDSTESPLDKGTTPDEENWLAQYGQVTQYSEEPVLEFPVVDLWDWELLRSLRKDRKGEVTRLVGRLMRRCVKLHPSLPSGVGRLKTAPICEVYLDLVRVTTGQVYKLRSPSLRYLSSIPTYDSSNPTKDWGFPELSFDRHNLLQFKFGGKVKSNAEDEGPDCKDLSTLPGQISISEKKKSCAYRDRAAERRNLHGGFGVAPGQRTFVVDDVSGQSSPVSASANEAAAEALNMSFGSGSYARRMLENMGWKEGEGLGNTMKGLVEPIQPMGNIGNAGLGWNQGRRMKHH